MGLKRNTRLKNRVRQLRKNRGLGQVELCQILDIGQSTLSEIERNINSVGDEVIVRMYDKMGWAPGDIFYVEAPEKNAAEKIS